jgi:hypothetical protein
MGRKPRFHYPGAFYHALNRGNQRQAIFRSEADFQFFQHLLALAHQRYGVRWHGFCQMTNHYHLLAEVAEVPLIVYARPGGASRDLSSQPDPISPGWGPAFLFAHPIALAFSLCPRGSCERTPPGQET